MSDCLGEMSAFREVFGGQPYPASRTKCRVSFFYGGANPPLDGSSVDPFSARSLSFLPTSSCGAGVVTRRGEGLSPDVFIAQIPKSGTDYSMDHSRGMTNHAETKAGTVAEFDLTLLRPGKWVLKSAALLPDNGLWYGRQSNAMNYATWAARTFETMIVRLHNLYRVDETFPSLNPPLQELHDISNQSGNID